ncbi:MAG: 1-(5-phosphoribosyl)-5-[(5-phosphoribosylamino)methylideneamino] imidazole-4-carboxamide isomerase [Synergistaceae bacterium]|jgi:phosphoribosylformimino-5-aminoimidazole carboxamide ribotide isomerase|nr:1-(5-phosphoribosyl)-5-[(5-phosphoribosylamino)methylideneamino] imidazole-4-carboxamide isomerase [Synergistaceae bacterium]
MIIMPAIDLYNGQVVRLTRGDFSKMTAYSNDPCAIAQYFKDVGCTHLHVVDLEGAKSGEPKHLDTLSEITKLGFITEYGGGVRSREAIKDVMQAGAFRVMIGSLLFKTDGMSKELFEEFGNKLMPVLDTKGNRVVVSGWKKQTNLSPRAALVKLYKEGYKVFLVTAVDRDGDLQGPDLELYRNLVGDSTSIIAAGGISCIDDLISLKDVGVAGAVVGKAVYEGSVNIGEALKIARQ